MMLGLLIAGVSEQQGPTFIIDEYRTGRIDVYPETMLFKFLNYVPESAIERVRSRVGVQE